jgi:2-keto-4-pentenoate hydratase
MLGVQTSLLGFLPVTTQYPEGALIDLAGTQRPGVEAEIAVHMRRSVAADDSETAIADAIVGLTISAEIVDIGGDHTDESELQADRMSQGHPVRKRLGRFFHASANPSLRWR